MVIAETAYPFTLEWNDNQQNIIGLEEQLIPGISATPEGQKEFLKRIKSMCLAYSRCKGFCYWGGDWISFKNELFPEGSPWENQALFNFNNEALPALSVFKD